MLYGTGESVYDRNNDDHRLRNSHPTNPVLNEDIMNQEFERESQVKDSPNYISNEKNTVEASDLGVDNTQETTSKKSLRSKQSTVNKNRDSRIRRRRGSIARHSMSHNNGTVSLAMQILNMSEEEKR